MVENISTHYIFISISYFTYCTTMLILDSNRLEKQASITIDLVHALRVCWIQIAVESPTRSYPLYFRKILTVARHVLVYASGVAP